MTNPPIRPKRAPKPKEKKSPRFWLAVVGGTVAVALLGISAVAISFVSQLSATGIEVYDAEGEKYEPEPINGPVNMLLIGSDTRQGQGSTKYGPVGNALADVVILLHLSEDRSNAVAISFPRDLMVEVPSCPNPEGGDPFPASDYMQLNATMNNGGPACTLMTIQRLTGITIPHLAMIDFKGVIAMSQAVGGVTVCLAEPIQDDYTQLYLDAGEHTLIGEQALQFLRTRHGVGDGSDLSRISNQQVYLTSLMRKLKDRGTLTNPIAMFNLATAALDNMTLSRSLTNIGTILGMAQEVSKVDLDKITFVKLPVYSLSGDYAGRVGVIKDQAQVLFDKLAADAPLIFAKPNIGQGATLSEAEKAALEEAEAAAEQATVSEEVLPDYIQGTRADVETCSN